MNTNHTNHTNHTLRKVIGAALLPLTFAPLVSACTDPTNPVAVAQNFKAATASKTITPQHIIHPVVSDSQVAADDVDMLGVVDYSWYKTYNNRIIEFGTSVYGKKLTASTSDKLVYEFACWLWNKEQVDALTPAQLAMVMKDGHTVLGF